MRGPTEPSDRPRCTLCGRPALLVAGHRACADCESTNAWAFYGAQGQRLQVDHETLREVEARLRGVDSASAAVRGMREVPYLVAALAAAAAAALTLRLFQPVRLDSLDVLVGTVRGRAGTSFVACGLALGLGIVALVLLRRSRRSRSVARALAAAAAIGLGGLGLLPAGLQWIGAGPSGWHHLTLPPLEAAERSALEFAVSAATVVLLATPDSGDARDAAIGMGTIVRSDASRAWVLTCRHVAMPGAAVGAFVRAEEARPVHVTLSDGRAAPGRVVWSAAPPLDVALVEVEVDAPPAAVAVAPDADEVLVGAAVQFAANPLRNGWSFHRGRVYLRAPHLTPAGLHTLLHTDLPVLPGDSGSGLFDARGRLVGVNTWSSDGLQGPVGISLPSEIVSSVRSLIDGRPESARGDAR